MKRITLIHQNDTHAHIDPHWELRWQAGEPQLWRAGGYAHIRAIADRIRGEVGDACVHVDSGDAIHGTGAAQWTQGEAIVPALNAVGVDLLTPGNWEFGFGPNVLRARVATMQFPVIACNVLDAATGAREFEPADVRDVGGVRVAFIGITSPIVTRTMPQEFGAGLRFQDALDVLPETVSRLRERERPDLVVLVSHYGFAQEVAIARAVDDIDVILGGHTHDVLAAPVRVGRTIITQAGAHGSYVARLDLELAHGRVCGLRHELIPVPADGPADARVADVIAGTLAPHREALDEVVGESATLLHRGTVLTAPMDTVITEAYRATTGADVALSHGWRYGTPIPAGPVTMGDLWQMIPTNPELVLVKMTGDALRHMLEESVERTFAGDLLRQQGGYVMRFAGMNAVVRLNNPRGTRVQQLEIGGASVAAEREYTVAAAGEQNVKSQATRTMTGVRAIDSVRAYLATRGRLLSSIQRPTLVAV